MMKVAHSVAVKRRGTSTSADKTQSMYSSYNYVNPLSSMGEGTDRVPFELNLL